MNRIKRIATELLERYPDKFGLEFNGNKNIISEVASSLGQLEYLHSEGWEEQEDLGSIHQCVHDNHSNGGNA